MIFEILSLSYSLFEEALPTKYKLFIPLLIYSGIILMYILFIWVFYTVLSKRDLFQIDLDKYNTSQHPFVRKFFASVFFFIEYMLILPFIICIWFVALASFLLVLSKNQSINEIIIISASLILAIRVISYFSEDMSREVAKLLPFILLGVFLTEPNFFLIKDLFSRISDLPNLISDIIYYLVFIFAVEMFFRVVYLIVYLFWE